METSPNGPLQRNPGSKLEPNPFELRTSSFEIRPSCFGFRIFLLMLFALPSFSLAQDLEIRAHSLRKADLPDDFPFQVLQEGFAIVRVKLENATGADLPLDLSSLEIRKPGGKTLKRADPTEIAPKLMKYYRGGNARFLGEAHVGRRPTAPELQRSPSVGADVNAGSIDVSTGTRLRTILQSFQLPESTLPPGESVEGFVYVRSKKSGTHLRGGSVQLGESKAEIP